MTSDLHRQQLDKLSLLQPHLEIETLLKTEADVSMLSLQGFSLRGGGGAGVGEGGEGSFRGVR